MRPIALLLLLFCAACVRPIPPGTTQLVYATPYGPGHPFSRADQAWMDFVRQRSGGSLDVRPVWSGALLSADQSMIELRHGVADVGLITPIYVRGGAHLVRVQSGFYSGVEEIEHQVALYRCLAAGSPQIRQELHGLKVLAVQGGGLPGIITRDRPVRRLADLRGMRIRVPTELTSVFRHLGADPVNMPMGEVYSQLAKGVLDGVVAPPDTFQALHFAEVAKHFTSLKVPRGAYPARAMSLERWDRLSPEHQRVLEEGIAIWEAALAREIRAATDQGLEAAAAGGVATHDLPQTEQSRFDALYLRDAAANAAALARYGIDGTGVFRAARASVAEDGQINCRSVPNAPAA
ncbi:TRAP transporter substrate-binding protein DctP [Sphingosinicella sp. CPCC 101087]|uniref:TRAP transporter substrate-binding protein DctP n=1 Tax=Sphingosinicella sp. CPCC 101087 TaxID=2497754 RepID=UPI0013ECB01E|nr:TRAP transporter substrate-binding protein DctP [Sphingosinicella sp. CPCC 101087]